MHLSAWRWDAFFKVIQNTSAGDNTCASNFYSQVSYFSLLSTSLLLSCREKIELNRARLIRASHQKTLIYFFSINNQKHRFQQLVSFNILERFFDKDFEFISVSSVCCLSFNLSCSLSPITSMVIFSVFFLMNVRHDRICGLWGFSKTNLFG